MTEFIVRIYENGGRRYLKDYDYFAMNALATALTDALGGKSIEIGRSNKNKDIILVFREKTGLENSLIRVKPENLLTYKWAEYVQLHLLDPKNVVDT
jgi:hypothetical protein